ncbi:DUF2939 domain-containing protein [Cognatilysobacter lacus]|uniref:DUF2939 domain-containing protein n=1 Tax=Cognatilysobacter lacus TaxID=1643323 RepID=A0A5D8YKI9_9GAMM|nr:DUF2939 domain-containing protein [Lysobacter lacus]TZF82847.1 DUF2939 domain-containing protein [Lysobacter lacus]
MKRSTALGLGIAAALAVAYVAASPYLAVRAIRDAAVAGDAPRVAEHVDFPALKESLNAHLAASMMQSAAERGSENPMAGAGAMFAMALMGPMIDAVATPEGLAALMTHGALPKLGMSDARAGEATAQPGTQVDAQMRYRDFDTFVVTLSGSSSSVAPLGLVFRRHRLIDWKLTSIDMSQ